MTIERLFELCPLSEKTLTKWGYRVNGFMLLNDMGHPCEYRCVSLGGHEIGIVKYYKGRLLTFYRILNDLVKVGY